MKKPCAKARLFSAIMTMENKLQIALIVKPQGILGEVKVKALCDSAEDLKHYKTVLIDGSEYGVLKVRAQGDIGYIALKGVADRNAAELLRGKYVEIYREDAVTPPEGRYYVADLLGAKVYTEKDEFLGEVKEIMPAKTDVFNLTGGKKDYTFVSADGVIISVDVENKRITVNGKRFKEVAF